MYYVFIDYQICTCLIYISIFVRIRIIVINWLLVFGISTLSFCLFLFSKLPLVFILYYIYVSTMCIYFDYCVCHHKCSTCYKARSNDYTSILSILNELHWLLINKRCQFKILLLTFKSLNGCAPDYLCDMLNVYMPNRSLRSTAFTSFVSYRNRSIRLGKRLSGTSAAKLWNELPRNIQRADFITMFKKLLKNFSF